MLCFSTDAQLPLGPKLLTNCGSRKNKHSGKEAFAVVGAGWLVEKHMKTTFSINIELLVSVNLQNLCYALELQYSSSVISFL